MLYWDKIKRLTLLLLAEERLTDLVPGFFLLLASMHTVLSGNIRVLRRYTSICVLMYEYTNVLVYSGRPAAFQDALVFPEARDAPVKVVKTAQCSLLEKICDAYCGTQIDKLQAARRNFQKLLR